MTHRQPATFGSPVFRICGATPLPNPVRRPRCRQSSGRRHSPARSPAAAAAPPDLQPPRGLPARSPPTPRASLGASARSPARPCRPRGSLQSGDLSRCFPSLSQPSTPHAIQNSPSTPEPSCKRYKTRPAHRNHHANGTKLAQHTQNTPKSAVFRKQGEYCHADCSKPTEPGEFRLTHQHHVHESP